MPTELLLMADVKVEDLSRPTDQETSITANTKPLKIKLEDTKALKSTQKNKAKKENGIKLSSGARAERLEGAQGIHEAVLDVDRQILHTYVPRIFLSRHYGGSPQGMSPIINTKKFTHGLTFTFYQLSFNPEAPQAPGSSGLAFHPSGPTDEEYQRLTDKDKDMNDIDEVSRSRAFVCVQRNEWMQLGIYRYYTKRSLSAQEFCELDPEVRRTWARDLASEGFGREIRLRIAMRKRLGRRVSWKEVEEEVEMLDSSDKVTYITPEDIEDAYTKGDEQIGVELMECVGYDAELQKEIVEKWEREKDQWLPKSKNKAKGEGSKAQAKRKRVKKEESGGVKLEDSEKPDSPSGRDRKKRKKVASNGDGESADSLSAAGTSARRETRSMARKK